MLYFPFKIFDSKKPQISVREEIINRDLLYFHYMLMKYIFNLNIIHLENTLHYSAKYMDYYAAINFQLDCVVSSIGFLYNI